MQLTVVVDNRARPPLLAQAAFAVWIEDAEGRAALFDTGGSGEVLLHNLAQLELDPARLQAVVLSHAHTDHTGGLMALLSLLPPGTPLFAHPTLFRQRYSDHGRGPEPVGPPFTCAQLEGKVRLRLSRAPQLVFPGLWTSGEVKERPFPEGRSARHFIHEQGRFLPDPYEDDMTVVLRREEGLFLLCGCCHAGLLNTVRAVEARHGRALWGVGGGMHLIHATPAQIEGTIEALAAMPALRLLWTGHCAGAAFERAVAAAFPDRWFPMAAGESLEFSDSGVSLRNLI